MARKKGSRNKKSVVTTEPVINESIWNNTQETPNTETETAQENTDTNLVTDDPVQTDSGSEQVDYKATLKEFDTVLEQAKNLTESPAEKRGRKSKAEIAQEKVKVPGRLFALMIDRVMANGLSIIDSATNKFPETIVPAQWLMADDKTLEEMAPIASMAAAELGVEEHPTITLFGLLLSNQLSQFMALKAMIRSEKKKNPDFDVMDLQKPKS